MRNIQFTAIIFTQTELTDDGAVRIFLYTKGKNADDVPEELVHFLEYVENSTAECADRQTDDRIRHIHKRVTAVKENQEWEPKYMTFDELLKKEYKKGLQTTLLLIQKMQESGEADKISMLSDEDFFEDMCRKYGVISEED